MEPLIALPPKSLCILRLSAIGDVMHMVPVVKTLQQHWPNCKITWIIGKLEATLVGDLPGVEFIIFDKSGGLKSLFTLRQQMRQRRFDVLLHMQVALRASLISSVIKTPIKMGFDRQRAHDYQWLFTNSQIDAKPQQHVLDGFFNFLEKLGITEKQLRWDIPISASDTQFIQQQLPNDKPILVINPCSSARLRNWPTTHYAAIVDYAVEKHGAQIVLSGGPSEMERNTTTEICKFSKSKIVSLVGQTSLKQLLALLKQAKGLIAPDTGPAHMATAVGTPVIGLYATSNPKRTGPYLSQKWTVNRYPDAAEKFLGQTEQQLTWGQRIRDPEAMDLITQEDVINKLDLLFKN